jgi:branched-chain amino acid transport system ATP-binding protein
MTDGSNAPRAVLTIRDLRGGYGEGQVLQGVSLDLREGEVTTLLGRNGAGKTTTLRAIVGMLQKRSGSIVVNGTETIGLPISRIARLGLGYVPEERGIFATLSVKENLFLPPHIAPGGLTEAEIFELFPNLRERLTSRGTKLSGGEQQMLAIARVLHTGAKLLLLDEPTEGLAPVIVQQIGRTIRRLKERGFSILLVEQNVKFASTIADRHYLYEEGSVVQVLSNDEIRSDMASLRTYLGV